METHLWKKQHEMFLYQMLGFSVCMVTMRKPFARSTVLVCTDSWHGFPHGFFAQIFCADVNREFLHGSWHVYLILYGFFAQIFLHGFLRIFCTDFCTDFVTHFLRRFLGVSQTACWETKDLASPRKSLEISSKFWGPSGEGLGNPRSEVETLAQLGVGEDDWLSNHSRGPEPKFVKTKSKPLPRQGMLREGGLSRP